MATTSPATLSRLSDTGQTVAEPEDVRGRIVRGHRDEAGSSSHREEEP
jgi:hypothetical protein